MYPQTCDRVLKPRKGHQEHNQPVYNVGSPSTHPRNLIGMTIRRWADGGPFLDVFFIGLTVEVNLPSAQHIVREILA